MAGKTRKARLAFIVVLLRAGATDLLGKMQAERGQLLVSVNVPVKWAVKNARETFSQECK
jgi:hypothetical protein